MSVSITFSHDDTIGGLWTGVSRPLIAHEIDQNFYNLKSAVETLQADFTLTISIESVTQPSPSVMRVTKTDASFDDIILPVGAFTDRGDWAVSTPYLVNDTFNAPDGGLYRVIFDHTSDATSFDPNANDGAGHDYYASMIPPRGNTLPDGGAVAMYFRKSSSTNYDANWSYIPAIEVVYSASTTSTLVSDNVSDALEELDARTVSLDGRVTTLEGHVITAIEVTFTPSTASGLTATNVGDAIEEVVTLIGSAGAPPIGVGSWHASPTGNVSTSEKAMGLGGGADQFTFVPEKTGRVLVWIGGMVLNSTAAGDGVTITGRWGTGTPPSNGDTSGLGTQFSIPQHFVASTTDGQQGFLVMGVVTGMTVGTVYWFDLSIVAVTGGGATVKDVQFVAVEVS
jgi:hypothetical protein